SRPSIRSMPEPIQAILASSRSTAFSSLPARRTFGSVLVAASAVEVLGSATTAAMISAETVLLTTLAPQEDVCVSAVLEATAPGARRGAIVGRAGRDPVANQRRCR